MGVKNAKEIFVWMMVGSGKNIESLPAICALLSTKIFFIPALPGTACDTMCLFASTPVSDASVFVCFYCIVIP